MKEVRGPALRLRRLGWAFSPRAALVGAAHTLPAADSPEPPPNTRISQLALVIWISATLLPGAKALAWSEPGHNVIAARAYQELSPDLKAKTAQILQSHPQYETWR